MKNVDFRRGAANWSLIIVIALLGIAAFLVVRIGPVYYDKKAMDSALQDIAVEAPRMSRSELVDAITEAGRKAGIELTNENINILYSEGGLTMRVTYSSQADLIVTTYRKDFELQASAKASGIENRAREEVNYPPPMDSSPSGSSSSPPPPNPGGPYAGRARDAGKKIGGE